MNIVKEFKNNLLKRKEVEIIGSYESNPGFEKTKHDIATHFKISGELIVIKNVKSSFGSNEFLINAFIYNSSSDREKIEQKKKEKIGQNK